MSSKCEISARWCLALWLGLSACHQAHNFGDPSAPGSDAAGADAHEADPDAADDADADASADLDAAMYLHRQCDLDRDTHHDPACVLGAFEPADDCDDNMATTHPGAPEVCNQRDDDCDGKTDEAPLRCTIAVDPGMVGARTEFTELAAGSAGEVYAAGELSGHITLAGIAFGVDPQDRDAFLVRYEANGDAAWATRFGSSEPDTVSRVTASDDAVLIAGKMGAATRVSTLGGSVVIGAGRYLARVYASVGEIDWIVPIEPPTNATVSQELAEISALAVDATGRILRGCRKRVRSGRRTDVARAVRCGWQRAVRTGITLGAHPRPGVPPGDGPDARSGCRCVRADRRL